MAPPPGHTSTPTTPGRPTWLACSWARPLPRHHPCPAQGPHPNPAQGTSRHARGSTRPSHASRTTCSILRQDTATHPERCRKPATAPASGHMGRPLSPLSSSPAADSIHPRPFGTEGRNGCPVGNQRPPSKDDLSSPPDRANNSNSRCRKGQWAACSRTGGGPSHLERPTLLGPTALALDSNPAGWRRPRNFHCLGANTAAHRPQNASS